VIAGFRIDSLPTHKFSHGRLKAAASRLEYLGAERPVRDVNRTSATDRPISKKKQKLVGTSVADRSVTIPNSTNLASKLPWVADPSATEIDGVAHQSLFEAEFCFLIEVQCNKCK
jgi:hypothetical protein